MKTIMLVCSAGMSTSMLVTKMEKAAVEGGNSVTIFACSEAEAKERKSVGRRRRSDRGSEDGLEGHPQGPVLRESSFSSAERGLR